jgi:hypothetical protein
MQIRFPDQTARHQPLDAVSEISLAGFAGFHHRVAWSARLDDTARVHLRRTPGGTSSPRSNVKPKYLELISASSQRGYFRIDDDEAMTRNLTCDVAMSEK